MSVNVWLPPLFMLALGAVGLMVPAGRRALVVLLLVMRRQWVEFPLRLVLRRPRADYARIRELETEVGYREPARWLGGGKATGLAWSMAAGADPVSGGYQIVRLVAEHAAMMNDADADADMYLPGAWKALQSAEEAAALAEKPTTD